MPSIIVQDPDGNSWVLRSKAFPYEDVLQRNVAELPGLVALDTVSEGGVSHLTIGTEWPAGSGRADIVLIGSDAVLTIIEAKLSRNPEARREVIAQLLEYAAYLSEWTIFDIQREAEEFFKSDRCPSDLRGVSLDEALQRFLTDSATDEGIESFKGKIEQNLRQGRIRLIVAVDEVGEQAQRIVTFVNSCSSFDIYLLQISAFEQPGGRQIFVPTLHGYARKVSTTRDHVKWDWAKYETELGWTREQVERAQKLHARLEAACQRWRPETRFNGGWTTVYCRGKAVCGVQVWKRRGLELWFRLEQSPEENLPRDVIARQTKSYLYLCGTPENLKDDQLQRVCEAAFRQVGLLSSSNE
jgi:hypothetical protein